MDMYKHLKAILIGLTHVDVIHVQVFVKQKSRIFTELLKQ